MELSNSMVKSKPLKLTVMMDMSGCFLNVLVCFLFKSYAKLSYLPLLNNNLEGVYFNQLECYLYGINFIILLWSFKNKTGKPKKGLPVTIKNNIKTLS